MGWRAKYNYSYGKMAKLIYICVVFCTNKGGNIDIDGGYTEVRRNFRNMS